MIEIRGIIDVKNNRIRAFQTGFLKRVLFVALTMSFSVDKRLASLVPTQKTEFFGSEFQDYGYMNEET